MPRPVHLPLLVAASFGLAACGPSETTTGTKEPTSMSSMSISEADTQARRVIAAVEGAVRAQVPGVTFAEPKKRESLCGTDGRSNGYLVSAAVPVSEEKWAAVEAAVHDAVVAHGYPDRAVVRDETGGHDISYGAPTGP